MAYSFEIHGIVSEDLDGRIPLTGVDIFETYTDTTPVAITDADGHFKYETGSDVDVEIYPTKRGYYYSGKNRFITKEMAKQDIKFEMLPWYVKKDNFEIYTILENDKDCKLNTAINVTNFCAIETLVPQYKANDYTPEVLTGDNDCGGSRYVFPNADGKLVIKNLNPTMNFFTSQWNGGRVFFEEPTEPFYYSVNQNQVDIKIEVQQQWFKMVKSIGGYKEYDDWPSYKKAYEKNIYKFCKRKLDELEQREKEEFTPESKEDTDDHNDNQNADALKEKQDTYNDAKENEQSLENRMLGGLTTAATGLGGMELAQGLSEKKADKEAEADMAAYLATFRCTYGDGKSVKGGVTPIELPGGNDTEMMKLRNEYFALAQSLKERKESLGMKPGIESEEILDKTQMGLYDDENTGISGGNYASLYRAQMGNADDKSNIDADKEKSDKRVKIGGSVAGIGVVGGALGNSLINGKLGNALKKARANEDSETAQQESLIQQSAFKVEPNKCSWDECLSMVTISDRTKAEPYYKTITKFCSSQFPNNSDCVKIMLMYSRMTTAIKEYDTLVANKYDLDDYKRHANYYCDSSVCDEDGYSDTILFSDYAYADAEDNKYRDTLTNDIRKCFKIAGAKNYSEFYAPHSVETKIVIDFDKVDCAKLDEGKTESDTLVKGLDIKQFMHADIKELKTLFGKYANFIGTQETETYKIWQQREKNAGSK